MSSSSHTTTFITEPTESLDLYTLTSRIVNTYTENHLDPDFREPEIILPSELFFRFRDGYRKITLADTASNRLCLAFWGRPETSSDCRAEYLQPTEADIAFTIRVNSSIVADADGNERLVYDGPETDAQYDAEQYCLQNAWRGAALTFTSFVLVEQITDTEVMKITNLFDLSVREVNVTDELCNLIPLQTPDIQLIQLATEIRAHQQLSGTSAKEEVTRLVKEFEWKVIQFFDVLETLFMFDYRRRSVWDKQNEAIQVICDRFFPKKSNNDDDNLSTTTPKNSNK